MTLGPLSRGSVMTLGPLPQGVFRDSPAKGICHNSGAAATGVSRDSPTTRVSHDSDAAARRGQLCDSPVTKVTRKG